MRHSFAPGASPSLLPPGSTAPVALWGGGRGRLPSPREVRVAPNSSLAWAVCTPEDGTPTLVAWRPQGGDTVWRLRLAAPGRFGVSRDGGRLFFTDDSGWCALLDAATGHRVGELRDAPGEVSAVALGDGIVVVARGARVRCIDLATGRRVAELTGDAPVAISPDDERIALTTHHGRRAVLAHRDGAITTAWRSPVPITAIDLTQEATIVLGRDDGNVAVHAIGSGMHRRVDGASESPVTVLRRRADGSLAIGHRDGGLRVVRPDGSAHDRAGRGAVEDIAPDFDAVMRREAQAGAWSDARGATACDLRGGHADAVTSIQFTHDGARCLTTSRDGTLRLWNASVGETLQVLEGHTGAVTAAALSPDGLRAWSLGEDDGLRAWDIDSGVEREVQRHAGIRMRALVASPAGDRLLLDTPSMAVLVDADDGRVVARVPTMQGLDGAASFDASGATLYVVSGTLADGSLRVARIDARTGDALAALTLPAVARASARERPCVIARACATAGYLALGDTDRTPLSRWTLDERPARTTRPFGAHLLTARRVSIGTRLIAAGFRAHVELCAQDTGAREQLALPLRHDTVSAVCLTPDEAYVMVGTAMGVVARYTIR